MAEDLIHFLPHDARYVLGDWHDNAQNVKDVCEHTSRFLVTTQYGSSPHTDSGVQVRQLKSVKDSNDREF